MSYNTSGSEDEGDVVPEKIRRFSKGEERRELLPIKVGDRLIRQYAQPAAEGSEEEEEDSEEEDGNQAISSLANAHFLSSTIADEEETKQQTGDSGLSAVELLMKRRQQMVELKGRISQSVESLTTGPEQNILRLHDLYRLASGTAEDLPPFVTKIAQRLGAEALAEVFASIAPGYQIRPLTDAEQTQKMKLETRRTHRYETTLLEVYQKFLSLLGKNALNLIPKKGEGGKEKGETKVGRTVNKSSLRLASSSVHCLCRLLTQLGHFNNVEDIIAPLVRLCVVSTSQEVLERISEALVETFRVDKQLAVTLCAVRKISEFTNAKKSHVWPGLIATLLSLNIRESDIRQQVAGETKAKERRLPKKGQGQHISRNKRKLVKKLQKKEAPFRELEATQRLSERVRLATEAMKHLFTTYFRILKRMPTTNLLPPVLEGLAKFAHLINVDFFDDLVATLGTLVEQKHLKVSEVLHCIKTVCVMLSGEGQALNIDPLTFYDILYNVLPSLPFQPENALTGQIASTIDCLDMLLVRRRKLISLGKAAAFVKRTLLICLLLPAKHCVALLAITRAIFVAHPGLCNQVGEDAQEDVVANGVYRPDGVSTECSNSLCTDFFAELELLSKHPNRVLSSLATNIQHKLPSSGQFRLSAQVTSILPKEWLSREDNQMAVGDGESPFKPAVQKFFKKQKVSPTSKNLCSVLCNFLQAQGESRRK